jgi:hypothetical protein
MGWKSPNIPARSRGTGLRAEAVLEWGGEEGMEGKGWFEGNPGGYHGCDIQRGAVNSGR